MKAKKIDSNKLNNK